MHRFNMVTGIAWAALMTVAGAAHAATFVYVSNAEDGNIGVYTLQPNGTLQAGPRVDAGKIVMPMSVSPDCHWQADLSLEHADREAAARLSHCA